MVEEMLGVDIPLTSAFGQPIDRHLLVSRNAFAFKIQLAQHVLSELIPALCRQHEPLHSFGHVFFNHLTQLSTPI